MAALELAAEIGYGRLTIEGIATRAGVGKQTIYRWWPSKADILLEAGAAKADLHVPVTDHGSYRADLRVFLEASYRMASYPGLADLLRALMAEAQIDPEFGDRFRAAFLERRREALAVIIDRARERGDLPPPRPRHRGRHRVRHHLVPDPGNPPAPGRRPRRRPRRPARADVLTGNSGESHPA